MSLMQNRSGQSHGGDSSASAATTAIARDIVEKCEEAAAMVTCAARETEAKGWQPAYERHGVRVERNKRSKIHAWRAFGHVDATLAEVIPVASGTESRVEWDPMCCLGCTIDALPATALKEGDDCGGVGAVGPEEAGLQELYACVNWAFGGILSIVSPRDMCLAFRVKRLAPGVWVSAAKSMEHPSCPPVRGCVRGVTRFAGLLMEACPTGGIDVTYVASVDPKGWLPGFAVNMGAGKGAMVVDFLRQYVTTGRRADWTAE